MNVCLLISKYLSMATFKIFSGVRGIKVLDEHLKCYIGKYTEY